MIINSTQNGSRLALLEDKKLVEYHQEHADKQYNVGDIYLGTVRKVVPGLNAAFIDLAYEKDAFLHYLDMGPNVRSLLRYTKYVRTNAKATGDLGKFKREPEIDKFGKINQVLKRGQEILVQIVKEPISSKGPRLSCELSIAGRFLVLVPFSDTVSVSKRISSSQERKRLVRLVSSIKPAGFGVIVRTVAEGKDVAELDKDLSNLFENWKQGMQSLKKAKPPELVMGEMGKASSLLRDILSEEFDQIVVDNKGLLREVKGYIKKIAPAKEKIVKSYSGRSRLFEAFGIEKQLKSLFGQSVSLKGGGYLIIEHTEALHVIDVNSGNKSTREENQEKTAVSVNLEAAEEIARQLRLRDMGGIIVVDFIDMRRPDNKKLIYRKMKEAMEPDRSKYTILPLTKFGLMQITRQRVRPELNISTVETCPTCGGSGTIAASILVADEIEEKLDYLITKQNESKLTLVVQPYLYAYFTKGFNNKRMKWFFKYNRWINVMEDTSLPVTEYKFLNKEMEEIEVQEA